MLQILFEVGDCAAAFAQSPHRWEPRHTSWLRTVIVAMVKPPLIGRRSLPFAGWFLGESDDVVKVFILIGVLILSLAKLFAQLAILLELLFEVLLVPKVLHDLADFRFTFLRSHNTLRDFQPIELVFQDEILGLIRVLLAKIHMRKSVNRPFSILNTNFELASISSLLSLIHLYFLVDLQLGRKRCPFFEIL